MSKSIRKPGAEHESERVALGELISSSRHGWLWPPGLCRPLAGLAEGRLVWGNLLLILQGIA
jgi:hypothetical protein